MSKRVCDAHKLGKTFWGSCVKLNMGWGLSLNSAGNWIWLQSHCLERMSLVFKQQFFYSWSQQDYEAGTGSESNVWEPFSVLEMTVSNGMFYASEW